MNRMRLGAGNPRPSPGHPQTPSQGRCWILRSEREVRGTELTDTLNGQTEMFGGKEEATG